MEKKIILECISKNETKASSAAVFAVDPKPVAQDGKTGIATRQTINFSSADLGDISVFEVGKLYTLTFKQEE